jgi:tetratricopeptide (TPR) repeat protein
VTRNNFAVNRWGRAERQVGAPRSWYSSPGNWGRSWWGGRPAWTWGRPWYWQHAGWHHGFWNYWARPPALWFGAGLAGGWFLSPGDSFTYFNPYFVAPPAGLAVFDYSEPLPAVPADEEALALPPDPDAITDPAAPPAAPTDGAAAEANRLLDRAREAFRAGQYAQAEAEVDTAIRLTPSDPTLHEFRALALFAQGNYRDAAAALYAVLTAGPGWDWATMSGLYPDVATYTAQLRALERFVADNPAIGYGHFVLAYHYLVTGGRDAAVRELREAVRLQPDDKLSQALLTSLTSPEAAGVAPPAPGR